MNKRKRERQKSKPVRGVDKKQDSESDTEDEESEEEEEEEEGRESQGKEGEEPERRVLHEDSDGFSDTEELDEDDEEEISWIRFFVNLKGNEFFCAIEEGYLEDEFNLVGLKDKVEYFDLALDIICDIDNHLTSDIGEDLQALVHSSADTLYGLLHARYILTEPGLEKMKIKFEAGHFGECPRVACKGQNVLPCGQTDKWGKHPLRLYCPKCRQLYHPKSKHHIGIDGSYFGTSFPHMFLFSFSNFRPMTSRETRLMETFAPRVYGFKVNVYANRFRRRLSKFKAGDKLLEGDDFELDEVPASYRSSDEEFGAGGGGGKGKGLVMEEEVVVSSKRKRRKKKRGGVGVRVRARVRVSEKHVSSEEYLADQDQGGSDKDDNDDSEEKDHVIMPTMKMKLNFALPRPRSLKTLDFSSTDSDSDSDDDDEMAQYERERAREEQQLLMEGNIHSSPDSNEKRPLGKKYESD